MSTQCSVLGQLLFITYLVDITKLNLSKRSRVIIYADNLFLYKSIRSPLDYQHFQEDICSIKTKVSNVKPQKCKVMVLTGKKTKTMLSVMVNNRITGGSYNIQIS